MFEEDKDKINLVNFLEKSGYIKSENVKKAFLKISRENFIPTKLKKQAYLDSPLEIGNGQTISAPHMIAIMCELLELKKGQKVLEIGTGSGYHASIVSNIIGDLGNIYSVERIDNLAKTAERNIKKEGIKNISIKVGDGSEGLDEFKPYDRIYVTCASPDIPQALIDQLKDPGMILIPVGRTFCKLKKLEKKSNTIKIENICECAFVPLIGKYGH